MKKKILAIAACAAMVLSLTACGNDENPLANLPQSSASKPVSSANNNSKPAASSSKPAASSAPAESKPVQSSSTPQPSTPEPVAPPAPAAPVDWDSVPVAKDEDFNYEIIGDLNNSAAVLKAYIGSAEYVKMPSELGGEKNIRVDNSVEWGANTKAIMLADGCYLANQYYDWYRGVWLDNNGIGIGPNVTEVVFPDRMTVIGAEGMTKLEKITLPKYLQEIKPNGFKDSKITELIIPDGTKMINKSAFMGCANLNSVTFPSGIEVIDGSAFKDCTDLTEINFPENFSSSKKCTIVGYAFAGCKKLTSVEIPSGVNFDGGLIKEYDPSSGAYFNRTLNAGNNLFDNCTSLETVTFGDGLDYIPNDFFRGCSSLTEVNWPDGLTEIGNGVFGDCTSLSEVSLPDGLKRIGIKAFMNCTSLRSLTIPDSTKLIGYDLMKGCKDFTISYLGQTFNSKNYVKICNSDEFGDPR